MKAYAMLHIQLLLTFLSICLQHAYCQAQPTHLLQLGSSLTPSNSSTFSSPSSTFTLSFLPSSSSSPFPSPLQQFYLAISFTVSPLDHPVWIANRDTAVSASATLTLSSSGNLILSDPSISSSPIWSSHTHGIGVVGAKLVDSGNLVLVNSASKVMWQSFTQPTDTLLPGQPFTTSSKLVSALRTNDFSPGRYALAIDNSTGILQLLYTSSSSSYWELGQFTTSPGSVYLQFDELGKITLYSSPASSKVTLIANDYGFSTPLRRVTLDIDGSLRMYTWDAASRQWKSVWLAFTDVCTRVLGLCGSYGVCKYDPQPKCVCPRGFSVVDADDISRGCSPDYKIESCGGVKFLEMEGLDYPYNDYRDFTGATEEGCKRECAKECSCRAAVYWQGGDGHCWLKEIVENGYRTTSQLHRVFLKVASSAPLVSAPLLDTPAQWSSQSLF